MNKAVLFIYYFQVFNYIVINFQLNFCRMFNVQRCMYYALCYVLVQCCLYYVLYYVLFSVVLCTILCTVQRCVHWDLQRQGWTSSGCTTIQTNLSHTSCSCQYISTYTVLQDAPGHQVYLQYIKQPNENNNFQVQILTQKHLKTFTHPQCKVLYWPYTIS